MKNKPKKWDFSLSSVDGLRSLAERLGVSLGVCRDEDVAILAKPVRVGGLDAPNSLAIHPMEGCDGDAQGRPGPLTVRRYERFAAGGAEIHPDVLNPADGKPLKFKPENEELRKSIIQIQYDPNEPDMFRCRNIPVRKASTHRKAFEPAWADFREGKFFNEYEPKR